VVGHACLQKVQNLIGILRNFDRTGYGCRSVRNPDIGWCTARLYYMEVACNRRPRFCSDCMLFRMSDSLYDVRIQPVDHEQRLLNYISIRYAFGMWHVPNHSS
jgi:hypothetical protein